MVRFSLHIAASRAACSLFVADYEGLCDAPSRVAFVSMWEAALERANAAHSDNLEQIWSTVWGCIAASEARSLTYGLAPLDALRAFASLAPSESVGELLYAINQGEVAATLNSEALRKACKKRDKLLVATQGAELFSASLLPRLYCSAFVQGLEFLASALDCLRSVVGVKHAQSLQQAATPPSSPDPRRRASDGRHTSAAPAASPAASSTRDRALLRNVTSEGRAMQRRGSELEWLHATVAQLSPLVIGRLVAHRGFHSVADSQVRALSMTRPHPSHVPPGGCTSRAPPRCGRFGRSRTRSRRTRRRGRAGSCSASATWRSPPTTTSSSCTTPTSLASRCNPISQPPRSTFRSSPSDSS